MIYIHRSDAEPNKRPLTANCQFVSILLQNTLFHAKEGIRTNANFRNTCPPVSNILCRIAYNIIFHMTSQSLKSVSMVVPQNQVAASSYGRLASFRHDIPPIRFYIFHFLIVVLHHASPKLTNQHLACK